MTMPALEVELKPSSWIRFFFFLVQFFAVLAITMLASPWLWVALLIWAGLIWRYRYLLSQQGAIKLKWDGAGWHYRSGERCEQLRLNHAVIWSWLVILNTSKADNSQHIPIVIFPHQCDVEQLRRLRVILRHQPVFGEDSKLRAV